VQQGELGHQPALDGVRAVAVVTVLLFHGGVSWMQGGYLGVSVFFTLSGFLITRLLIVEHHRSGSVALGAFVARRARRLLPASLLCLFAVVVASSFGAFPGVIDLRRDVVGAALQVANWVSLASGSSYADLLDASAGVASPVEHYWSLAIEEQFYWVWPLAFVGLTALARRRPGPSVDPLRVRRRLVVAATIASCVAAPLIATVWGPDAAYWATPARSAEILLGASLAAVLCNRGVRPLPPHTHLLAPLALGVVLTCCVVFPADGGPAYAGALPLFALVSTALLLGLQVPGPTRDLLSIRPLVGLGRISYGVYLYHWPIFVALDESRTGLGGPALFVLRIAVTLAAALASYRFVEQPIRRMTPTSVRPTAAAAAIGTLAVVATAFVVAPAAADDYWKLDQSMLDAAAPAAASAELIPLALAPAIAAPPPPTPTTIAAERSTTGSALEIPPAPVTEAPAGDPPPPVPALDPGLVLPRPLRVAVVGDSIAEALGAGVVSWALDHPGLVSVALVTTPGCGFVATGEYKVGDTWTTVPEACHRLLDERVPDALDRVRPDVVVLTATSWDLNERHWDGPVLLPTDRAYAAEIERAYRKVTELLVTRSDAVVVWLRHPLPNPFWLGRGTIQEQPAHHHVLWDAMERAAAEHPGRVRVLDLAGWATEAGLDTDTDARPDGIHWTLDAAASVADAYLVPWAVALAVSGR
jgi:peptidoglycan/LPS O-acetylase OafA/YrhL